MPLGFQRLNERNQRPNEFINFIKPLETPDKAKAEDFLQRIAAQCHPVMKKHHISVMSLEEYEPNSEFLGRNFNAGEVIQLVLKDRRGTWLSLKFVQMVMMHELAHCKQMNHSRFFWNVRNEYAKQMEELWRQGYRGEGMWGRGRGLRDGGFVNTQAPDASQIPEHLCGGTYRRRGRKRKRGQHGDTERPIKSSYAERQQRRIARKFGVHGEGESLGEDDLMRGALETMNGGKRGYGKPKVANSKRGRELRASAALARFKRAEATKQESEPDTEGTLDSETESESEVDDGTASSMRSEDVTVDDGRGHTLQRVCGDEGEADEDGPRQEIHELRMLGVRPESGQASNNRAKKKVLIAKDLADSDHETPDRVRPSSNTLKPRTSKPIVSIKKEDSETEDELAYIETASTAPKAELSEHQAESKGGTHFKGDVPSATTTSTQHVASVTELNGSPSPGSSRDPVACPICSLENPSSAATCMACAHVLQPALIRNCWRCKSQSCTGTKYINAGDAGRCGLCGSLRPQPDPAPTTGARGRAVDLISAEVLRWE